MKQNDSFGVQRWILQAQKGCDRSREMLAELPWLWATNPQRVADLVVDRTHSLPITSVPDPIDRKVLKDISVQFHSKAGTLTTAVRASLENLMAGDPIIRVAHQPNTFAYLGVYGQFILLDLVAQSLRSRYTIPVCQGYFIVDYDAAGDTRFRVSRFPDVERRDGAATLSVHVLDEFRERTMYATALPAPEQIDNWIADLRVLIEHNLTVLHRKSPLILEIVDGQVKRRLCTIEEEIWESYNRSSTLAEFNAIFCSRIVNLHWELPTAFFPLSHVSRSLNFAYEYLLQHYSSLVELSNLVIDEMQNRGVLISDRLRLNFDTFPFWYTCSSCATRVPLTFFSKSCLNVGGTCPQCGNHYRLDLGTYSQPRFDVVRGRMIPRIVLDVLSDIVGWRIAGGVGYMGGAEHAVVCGLIASRMNWPAPVECLWQPRGVYYGLAEARVAQMLGQVSAPTLPRKAEQALQLVLFGKATILYYLLSQGHEQLLQSLRTHFHAGYQSFDLNVIPGPFAVPEHAASRLLSRMQSLLQVS